MRILQIGFNPQPKQKVNTNNRPLQTKPMANDSVCFEGLMPDDAKKLIKLCVYDLDETLLEGPQNIREKIFDFAMDKTLVYSTARGLKRVAPLIDNKTLKMPDYCICNDGINIYKNINGRFEEMTSWSEGLMKNFDKNKVRNIMVKIARKNMFKKEEWAKIPKGIVPQGQNEFRGSKITEYETYDSPSNIYIMFAPGIFKKTLGEIEKQLDKNKIDAQIDFINYSGNGLDPKRLLDYFTPDVAKNIINHAQPRLNPDNSLDVAVIKVKTDKGKATEYLRKELQLKEKEIFASGDGENDYTHTNKGYFFALVSNAKESLKKLIGQNPPENIIKTTKPGVEGIWETIEP